MAEAAPEADDSGLGWLTAAEKSTALRLPLLRLLLLTMVQIGTDDPWGESSSLLHLRLVLLRRPNLPSSRELASKAKANGDSAIHTTSVADPLVTIGGRTLPATTDSEPVGMHITTLSDREEDRQSRYLQAMERTPFLDAHGNLPMLWMVFLREGEVFASTFNFSIPRHLQRSSRHEGW